MEAERRSAQNNVRMAIRAGNKTFEQIADYCAERGIPVRKTRSAIYNLTREGEIFRSVEFKLITKVK